jgi:hypothetical protein
MTLALFVCMTMSVPRSTLAFSIPGCRADNGAETKRHRTLFQRLLWLAAGSGAGHVAGPGGSAVVGVVKNRDDLTASPRRFFKVQNRCAHYSNYRCRPCGGGRLCGCRASLLDPATHTSSPAVFLNSAASSRHCGLVSVSAGFQSLSKHSNKSRASGGIPLATGFSRWKVFAQPEECLRYCRLTLLQNHRLKSVATKISPLTWLRSRLHG